MELMVRDGDYVADGQGGFRRVEGSAELLQRVLWKLTVRRGSFVPMPELGSRLHLLLREKPSGRQALAEQYVAEALAGESLSIDEIHLEGDGTLRVALEWQGERLEVEVGIT